MPKRHVPWHSRSGWHSFCVPLPFAWPIKDSTGQKTAVESNSLTGPDSTSGMRHLIFSLRAIDLAWRSARAWTGTTLCFTPNRQVIEHHLCEPLPRVAFAQSPRAC